jgi:hypothetical protein
MNLETLKKLQTDLEATTKPNLDLNADIAFTTGHYDFLKRGFKDCAIEKGRLKRGDYGDYVEVVLKNAKGGSVVYTERLPRYTISADEVLALAKRVLPSEARLGLVEQPDASWQVVVIWIAPAEYDAVYADGPTATIALLIAIVGALILIQEKSK